MRQAASNTMNNLFGDLNKKFKKFSSLLPFGLGASASETAPQQQYVAIVPAQPVLHRAILPLPQAVSQNVVAQQETTKRIVNENTQDEKQEVVSPVSPQETGGRYSNIPTKLHHETSVGSNQNIQYSSEKIHYPGESSGSQQVIHQSQKTRHATAATRQSSKPTYDANTQYRPLPERQLHSGLTNAGQSNTIVTNDQRRPLRYQYIRGHRNYRLQPTSVQLVPVNPPVAAVGTIPVPAVVPAVPAEPASIPAVRSGTDRHHSEPSQEKTRKYGPFGVSFSKFI